MTADDTSRLNKWTRHQLEEDVKRLWEVEKKCLSEISRLNDLLRINHICPGCGAVNEIRDCPFG